MSADTEWYLKKNRSIYEWNTEDYYLDEYTNKFNTDLTYKRLAIASILHNRLSVNINIRDYFTQDILDSVLIIFEKLCYKILLDEQVQNIYKMFDIYKKLITYNNAVIQNKRVNNHVTSYVDRLANCLFDSPSYRKVSVARKELLDTVHKNNPISKEYQLVNFIDRMTSNFGTRCRTCGVVYCDGRCYRVPLLKIINSINYKYIEFYIRNCNLIRDIDKIIDKIKASKRINKLYTNELYTASYMSKRGMHVFNNYRKSLINKEIQYEINYYLGQTLNIPKFGSVVLTRKVKNYNNRYIIQYPSGSIYTLKVDELIKIINEMKKINQIKMNYNDAIKMLKKTRDIIYEKYIFIGDYINRPNIYILKNDIICF